MSRFMLPFTLAVVILVTIVLWSRERPPSSIHDVDTDKAAIGGTFHLTTQDGARFTEKDLKGHYSLIFFGFTHCPDICPTTLTVVTQAINRLGPVLGEQVTPIFISLDPERDTQEEMKDYAQNFHPRLVALTGTQKQVERAAKAYKVYYSKVEVPGSALGYTIDHSGYLYLMGPDGNYVTHFDHSIGADQLADGLRHAMREQ